MSNKFGIDVGGTSVKIGYFDDNVLIDKFSIPTNRDNNGVRIVQEIAEAIISYAENNNIDLDEVEGYGFGIPGPIVDNVATICANLGWNDYNVKDEFNKYISCDNIQVANDANVAAAGEYWALGNSVKNLVMITFGTGVGGGIIIDGKLVEGTNGAAGEFGHIVVKFEDANQCGCGNKGCLETVASATGIVVETEKALAASTEGSTLRGMEVITAKDIFDAAKDGDKIALECVEQLGKYVGRTCSAIASTVNPDVFIIGGGVSAAGKILTDSIEKWYNEYAMKPLRDTKFKIAKLGNDAGIYGAAYITVK